MSQKNDLSSFNFESTTEMPAKLYKVVYAEWKTYTAVVQIYHKWNNKHTDLRQRYERFN